MLDSVMKMEEPCGFIYVGVAVKYAQLCKTLFIHIRRRESD